MAAVAEPPTKVAKVESRPTALSKVTPEQWKASVKACTDYVQGGTMAKRILNQFKAQDCDETHLGFALNLFQHGLQTATRALRNKEDEEMVVMALLHDLCEDTVPSGHGTAAGLILGPYLSDERKWILDNHEVFQGFYYYHHVGKDPNTRDRHKDSPYFDACARFCELYDAPSFDPDYENEPLSTFVPMVERFFSKPPKAQGDCACFSAGA